MDYISTLLGLYARYLTGEKNEWGWILAIVGGIIALVLQAKAGLYGLCLGNIFGMVLSLYYFHKWRKND